MSPIRFEPSGTDNQGYWGEPTSSIDWCERNYVHSHYIAEFFNTISNIGLVLAGVFTCYQSWKYKLELRFYALGLSVLVVGVGSALFHGTLLYWAQLWDEVPMVWAMLVWLYVHVRMDKERSILLAFVLTLYGLGWAVIHSLGAYTVGFQVHFGLMVVQGIYFLRKSVLIHLRLPFYPSAEDRGQKFLRIPETAEKRCRRMAHFYVLYLALAFVLWLIDQFACPHLHRMPGGIPNPQFHAAWHVLCGGNCHFGLQYVMALRQSVLHKAKPATAWTFRGLWGWMIPTSNEGMSLRSGRQKKST